MNLMTTQNTVRFIRLSRIAPAHLDEARRILSDDWDGVAPEIFGADPIIISQSCYILDGFHRVAAAIGHGEKSISAIIATEEERATHVGAGEDGEDEWIAMVLSNHVTEAR